MYGKGQYPRQPKDLAVGESPKEEADVEKSLKASAEFTRSVLDAVAYRLGMIAPGGSKNKFSSAVTPSYRPKVTAKQTLVRQSPSVEESDGRPGSEELDDPKDLLRIKAPSPERQITNLETDMDKFKLGKESPKSTFVGGFTSPRPKPLTPPTHMYGGSQQGSSFKQSFT